jgi:hypothetical protein
MNLSGLLPLLQQAPPFIELIDRLARNEAPTEPQAIYHAARACVTAALRHHRPAPLLLLTARNEMAQQLYEQLALWLPPVEDGGPPRYLFADPDALPYERITWSNDHAPAAVDGAGRAAGAQRPAAGGGRQRARADAEDAAPARTAAGAACDQGGQPAAPGAVDGGLGAERLPPGRDRRGTGRICPPRRALSTSGRPTCRCRCASTSLATRWRACASSTRPASARLRRCRASRSAPGSEALAASMAPMSCSGWVRRDGASSRPAKPHGEGAAASPAADAGLLLALREELRREVDNLARATASTASSGICPMPMTSRPA